jgi:hypothetical protein
MSRQSPAFWVPPRPSPRAQGFGLAGLVGVILAFAPGRAAAWGGPCPCAGPVVRANPPDQSWLMDIPEKPGARSNGKVAVFAFTGDDVYEPVRAAVVRLLRRRGLNVTTTLRPVDSAAQYREMSQSMDLAVYVDGDVSGEGARQRARIRLRSGVTGQRIASATFSGPTQKITGSIGRTLWTRVGPAVVRARSAASRPHRRGREPLHIDAGTTPEDTPLASQGG